MEEHMEHEVLSILSASISSLLVSPELNPVRLSPHSPEAALIKLLMNPLVKPPFIEATISIWSGESLPPFEAKSLLGFWCATLSVLLQPHWLLLNVLSCSSLSSPQPWLYQIFRLLLFYLHVFSALYTITPVILNTISFQICITNPEFSQELQTPLSNCSLDNTPEANIQSQT